MTRLAARALLASALLAGTVPSYAGETPTISTAPVVVPMVFPVIGRVSYTDTFLACRSGCSRQHLGQDLMGNKMLPLVATFDGYVTSLRRETTVGGGNYVSITGDNGWSVNYIHMNNDTPGTDDGRGTAEYAFAPGLSDGDRVFAGQLLGWLGDSGNAEGTAPHLHFELRHGGSWSGVVYNAKPSLDRALRISVPRVSGPHPDGSFVRTAAAGSPIWRISGRWKHRVATPVLAALGFSPAQVVVVSANEERWYRTGAPLPLPDGLAYQAPDGKVWFVSEGVRRPVPDAAALVGLGIRADRVRRTDYAAVLATPRAADPALPGIVHEGALLREAGTYDVWWVRDGVRRLVPNWYTLARLGRGAADVHWVPAGFFDPVPDPEDPELGTPGVPAGLPLRLPDGLQLMDAIDRRWVVTGGERRMLPGQAAGLYGWTRASHLRPASEDLARLPIGSPLP